MRALASKSEAKWQAVAFICEEVMSKGSRERAGKASLTDRGEEGKGKPVRVAVVSPFGHLLSKYPRTPADTKSSGEVSNDFPPGDVGRGSVALGEPELLR